MPRSAGTVRIVFEAGTASFVADVDKARAKVTQFGASTTSSMGAAGRATKVNMAEANAAVKALEGNFAGSQKAVTRFLAVTVGLGPVLQAAFPIIGLVLLGNTVVSIAGKVSEFFDELKSGPERVAGAMRQMTGPLRQQNDELASTNARLENDILKLEGHRQNTLKTALYEARVEADKLADSLEKDIGKLNEFLKENAVSGFGGWLKSLFGASMTTDLKELIGGKSGGAGGFAGDIAKINLQGQGAIDRAVSSGDLAAEKVARAALDQALSDRIRSLLADLGDIEYKATRGAPKPGAKGVPSMLGPIYAPEDIQRVSTMSRDKAEQVQAIKIAAGEMLRFLGLSSDNAALTGKKSDLTAAAENAKLNRPYEDRIQSLYAQIDGVTAKLESAGMGESAKVAAKAFGESMKAITEVNKALHDQHTRLTEAQEANLKLVVSEYVRIEAEAEWKTKLAESAAAIQDKVRGQELLTAAIGKGAEAERAARAEVAVMGAVGAERYNDPRWMAEHAGDVAGLRSGIVAQMDAERATSSAEAVYGLQEQIRAQNLLTEAEKVGEEEIRRLGAMAIWRAGIEKGLTGQQIVAEITLYYAKIRTQTAAGVAKIDAERTATEKLIDLQMQGAEAVRQQNLENSYAEMQRTGRGGEVAAQRVADEARHQLEIGTRIAERVNLYGDEAEKLNQERDQLLKIIGAHKATADQARALRDIQRERLALWVREQLAIGTLRAGVRAFFADVQANAKRPGEIFYDSMHSAVDRVSDELTKLITGEQTSFGAMLKGLGQDALRSTIKSGLERGLGALGKLFHVKLPDGKPDGTSERPFYVVVKNPGGSPAGDPAAGVAGAAGPAIGGLLKSAGGGILGFLKGLFGGGGGGTSTIGVGDDVFPGRASGGDVVAGRTYMVGERGPEPWVAGMSGTILSNALAHRVFGGVGPQSSVYVDARGADLGAEQRLYRAASQLQRASVSTSVQAMHERSRRTPQRTGA